MEVCHQQAGGWTTTMINDPTTTQLESEPHPAPPSLTHGQENRAPSASDTHTDSATDAAPPDEV